MNAIPTLPSKSVRTTTIATLTCAALSVMFCTGCEPRTTCFRITAFGTHGAGETFVETFPNGAFTRNALGNYQLAFELPPTRMPVNPPSSGQNAEPPITANAPPAAGLAPDEVYISQLVFIDLIWKPDPGNTFAESSQINAGITYCILRAGEVVRYEGAGFVYFELDDGERTMTGRIESATLRPAKTSDGAIDLLGPCRLTAEFVATQSGPRVADIRRRLIDPARMPATTMP